jgi:branched-chain amino acid transport system permease protein
VGYWAQIATQTGINVILAYSFYLTMLSGQFALSQATFMGLGAYASAVLTRGYGAPFPLAMLVAIVIGAIAGWMLGMILAGRLEGLYMAVATMAVGEALLVIYTRWELVGGGLGISGIRLVTTLPMVLVTCAVIFYAFHQFDHSIFGRLFRAAGDDLLAAQVSGVNVRGLRVAAFAASGVLGAVAGVYYAHFYGNVVANDFSIQVNMDAMLAVLLGGSQSLFGPLLGSVIVTLLPELLRSYVGSVRYLVFGVLLIVIMMFRPTGLIGRPRTGRRDGRARASDTSAPVSR